MSDFALGPSGGINRFDSFHGRDGSYHGALRYPSPFFDIGHTYLPDTVKHMFRWCRYYFLVNPLINAVAYKMAEYPITDIIVDDEDEGLRAKWKDIIENHFRMRSFLIEAGLDYFVYGNTFITIHWPFQKYLRCADCKTDVRIEKADYKWRNLRFFLSCDHCGTITEAGVVDHNVKSLKGIRLIRWNPENVSVQQNEVTGETAYFFEIPLNLRNDILIGKKHILETLPDIYIRALRDQKQLRFTDDNLYHLKRPTIAQKDMGWGLPLILPVLKDTYYLQILRKAQEAIANGYIIPLRVLFPQAGSASSDPYSTTDLSMWRKRVETEIQKWRLDPNYIPIMPLPIGNETIGGEGKGLMLHQEMRMWSEQILSGMHVPVEFIFGGASYAASNVTMRMLENQFLGYRMHQLLMCRDFVLKRVAEFLDLPKPKIRFKKFKMADDLQRASLYLQMNQAQKISDTTLLDELDFDFQQEEKNKRAELAKQMENQQRLQLAQAGLQGQVQVITARYQAKAQKIMMEAQGPPPGAAPQLPPPGDPSGASPPDPSAGAPGQEQQNPAGGPMIGTENQQPDMGQQAAPGMPPDATAYPENGQQMPMEGVPPEMQSPLNGGQQGGQYNLLYLARRAATELEGKPDSERYAALIQMKGQNPQLYTLVIQLLSAAEGSQSNPLDALQSPLSQQKPPRSPTPVS